jgi:peptide/nickel transport system permease protein
MAVIILAVIVSVLGYLITPDSTPYCNNQNLAIATASPGFRVKLLQVPFKDSEQSQRSWLGVMLFGQKSQFREVAVDSVSFSSDSVFAHEYTPKGINEHFVQGFTREEVLGTVKVTDLEKEYGLNKVFGLE